MLYVQKIFISLQKKLKTSVDGEMDNMTFLDSFSMYHLLISRARYYPYLKIPPPHKPKQHGEYSSGFPFFAFVMPVKLSKMVMASKRSDDAPCKYVDMLQEQCDKELASELHAKLNGLRRRRK